MVCFLCLTENSEDNSCSGNKLSLAVIFKHLQINLSSSSSAPQKRQQLIKNGRAVNNNYLLGEEGEKVSGVEQEVYLCKRCSEISKNLTDLYEELDVINRKLNSSLSQFEGQIKFGSSELTLDQDEKEDRKNDNQIGGGVGGRSKQQDILKRKAKEQCLKLLGSSGGSDPPKKLFLPKLKLKPKRSPIIPIQKSRKNKLPNQKPPKTSATFNGQLPSSLKTTSPSSITEAIISCPYCTSMDFTNDFDFEMHKIWSHVGLLFETVKFPDFDDRQFHSICEDVVEKEAGLCQRKGRIIKVQGGLDRRNSLHFECTFCAKPILKRDYISDHFLLDHRDLMREKVKIGQRAEVRRREEWGKEHERKQKEREKRFEEGDEGGEKGVGVTSGVNCWRDRRTPTTSSASGEEEEGEGDKVDKEGKENGGNETWAKMKKIEGDEVKNGK